MDKCYVHVIGGLGNQLFQVANGYMYSKKYDKELIINPTNWCAGQGTHASIYKDNIFKNFNYGSPDMFDQIVKINENGFNYRAIPKYLGNISLNGYFQSLKYFEDCKDEFISKLVLPYIKTSFITDNSVAFHIRRGDYKKYPHIYNVCDTNYFNRLFEEFKGCKINVFTDSVDDVLKEFEQHDFQLIVGNNELEDLTIMANHPMIVCSNSTFSWWASLLGVEKKKIIVPEKWLLNRDCSDIYNENMIKYPV